MRLVDIDPYIGHGWHLARTGTSNELLTVMSLADIQTVDPWKYHDVTDDPEDIPDVWHNVLVNTTVYADPIVAYRITGGWVSYGNDGGGFEQYAMIKNISDEDVLGWWDIPTGANTSVDKQASENAKIHKSDGCEYCKSINRTASTLLGGTKRIIAPAMYTIIGDGKGYPVPMNYCPNCGAKMEDGTE